MATTTATTPFVMRLIGALALDPVTYEEVEADRSATGQAMLVVVLSSVGAGIGARGLGSGSLRSMVFISAVSLLAWAAWALLTYHIGVRLMPEADTRSDVGELLRTTGFASSPGIIRFLAAMPPLTRLIVVVAGVWMLLAMIVAVRQALDYTNTFRAVAVCATGWIVQALILVGLVWMLGPLD